MPNNYLSATHNQLTDTEHRHLAQRRYDEYRKSALIATNNSLCPTGVTATEFTNEALIHIDNWDKYDRRDAYWDWRKVKQDHGRLYPKRFEIVLWEKDRPIGAAIGRPTYSGGKTRIDVAEGMPREMGDRSNVIETIIGAFEIYSILIGATEVRIMNPVNPKVREVYARYGYRYYDAGNYMFSEVM
ncbi:MAG: hypothetical protein ABNH16_02810 [Thalassolituus sp.]|jgi:hypothetical protein|tara:strand:+ start:284 stop:841 length:558 start_codon:yes stop_codon:yes gene_type:complete